MTLTLSIISLIIMLLTLYIVYMPHVRKLYKEACLQITTDLRTFGGNYPNFLIEKQACYLEKEIAKREEVSNISGTEKQRLAKLKNDLQEYRRISKIYKFFKWAC